MAGRVYKIKARRANNIGGQASGVETRAEVKKIEKQDVKRIACFSEAVR